MKLPHPEWTVRILVTRLGGVGDLFFIEPVIRALYIKHFPCEIVLRTYKDYAGVLDYHPLISDVIFDTNQYELGYHRSDLSPTKLELWNNVNPHFDYHFDFQGVMEEAAIETGSTIHATKLCAQRASVDLHDIVPQIHYIKKDVPSHPIVAQLKSAETHRSLDNNPEILEALSKFDVYYLPDKKMLGFQEFVSTINNCKLFVGTESCGSTIARGLNKPIVAFYQTEYRRQVLGYDNMKTLLFNQAHKLDKILGETWDRLKIF